MIRVRPRQGALAIWRRQPPNFVDGEDDDAAEMSVSIVLSPRDQPASQRASDSAEALAEQATARSHAAHRNMYEPIDA